MTQRVWPSVRQSPGALLAVLLALLIGPLPASGETPGIPSPPAARVGDSVITEAELEQRLPADMQRLRTERYELLRQALDDAVTERLLELEARSAGLSREALLRREVLARVQEPTRAEIVGALEMAGDRAAGDRATAEAQARQALRQDAEQAAYAAYLRRLGEKYRVQRLLEPPRTPVAAAGFPARGARNPRVTIVEFSDFECPFCLRVVEPLRRLLDRYPDDVQLVYRHFPLDDIHPGARKAAEASLCAHDQGRFWDFHDAIFRNSRQLTGERLQALAAELALDTRAFRRCLDGGRHAGAVAADVAAGEAAGVAGTPALFINGRFIGGAVPFEALVTAVEEELARLRSPVSP